MVLKNNFKPNNGRKESIMDNLTRTPISKELEKIDRKAYISKYSYIAEYLLKEYSYSPKMIKDLFGLPSEVIENICKDIFGKTDVNSGYFAIGTEYAFSEPKERQIASKYNIHINAPAICNSKPNKYMNREIDRDVDIDYSRIYPSSHCKEYAMRMTNNLRRTKSYAPLTDKLYGLMSTFDMAKLLLLEFRQISRPSNMRRTRVSSKSDDWVYGKDSYCVPYAIADMIDEFESEFFKTVTPIEKDDYPCKKLEDRESTSPEYPTIGNYVEDTKPTIPLPNGMVTEAALLKIANDLEAQEEQEEENNLVEEETMENVLEEIKETIESETLETESVESFEHKAHDLPTIIVPEGYLSDDAYKVLLKYLDCVGRRFLVNDSKNITVHNIFELAMAIFMLNSDEIANLKSLIKPIESKYVADDSYKISDLI